MIIAKSKKRIRNSWILHLLIAVLCVGALMVLAKKYVHAFLRPDQSLQRIVSAGVITIGYSIEAPHAFLTPDGQVTGVSPEIVRHIMGNLGVHDVRWRKYEFEDLINELEAGHIDMIAAGMVITSNRLQRIAFSPVVFIDPPSLLVFKGNPKNINHYQQIVDDPSVRIAVLLGAVEEQVYRSIGVEPARVVAIPDVPTIRAAIVGGDVDAVALPLSIVRKIAANDPLERTEVNESYQGPPEGIPCSSAFACRKEDRRLSHAVRKELDAFIGSEEYLTLISSFGLTESNVPPPSNRRGASHHE